MDVLRVIMGYDYLWNRIRVLGGAYGCMSSFGRSGGAFFVTYRDPHIRNSLQVFADAADYLTNYDADERSMTKSVIGAVSSLDRPLVPRQFGRMSLQAFLSGITDEDLQRERDEVLSCTAEDIRALAGPVRAFVSDSCICVVGSRDKILENQDLFDRVDTLEGDGETP
jgi:Zn-dependent M16 (insulinase) family peptidase